jgi:lysophospholipase L1-like esterase
VKKVPLNYGISLLTIVVLLVSAEFVVRHLFRDVTTTGDNRGYFSRRWRQAKVHNNSWGFRERDFDLNKPVGIYRIAIIGDSFTYGQGVDEEERFSNLLWKRLSRQNGAYEVLNFGLEGAETEDHLNILTQTVLPAKPDFVLLQWFVNDVEGSDKSGRPRSWPLLPSKTLLRGLRATSALFYLLEKRWEAIQGQLGWVRNYNEYMWERFGDANSPSSIVAQKVLQRFVETCKRWGVPVGIVLFGAPLAGNSPLDFLVDRVLALCEQEALTCVDTRSIFAPYGGGMQLWANRLDSHPGPLAHRLVANRLMDDFGETWSHR